MWIEGAEAVQHFLSAPLNDPASLPRITTPKPKPETTPGGSDPDLYRGQPIRWRIMSRSTMVGLTAGSVAIDITMKLTERFDGGTWRPCPPVEASGMFTLLNRAGESVKAVTDMLANALAWSGCVEQLTGEEPWSPPGAQARVEKTPQGLRLRWLMRFDAESPIERYLSKLPRGLQAGQHRSDVAYTFGAMLVNDRKMQDTDALAWLRRWNDQQATPLPDDKLATTIANARRYGKARRATA